MSTNPNPLGELRPFKEPPSKPGAHWSLTCEKDEAERVMNGAEFQMSRAIHGNEDPLYQGWHEPTPAKPFRVHHKNGLFLSLGNMPYFVSASGTHYMDGEVNNHASWHGLSRETESVREGIWVEFDPDNVGDWAKLLKRNKDGVLCLQTNQKCTACPDALVPTTIEWLRAFPALMDAVMAAPAAPSKPIALSDDDLDHMAKSYWQFDGGRFVFDHRAFARAAMRGVP